MAARIPVVCDHCGSYLRTGESRRFRFDVSYKAPDGYTRWSTDEFKRYYCPDCARKAKAWLISLERSAHERR